jgi:hypothetical protein
MNEKNYTRFIKVDAQMASDYLYKEDRNMKRAVLFVALCFLTPAGAAFANLECHDNSRDISFTIQSSSPEYAYTILIPGRLLDMDKLTAPRDQIFKIEGGFNQNKCHITSNNIFFCSTGYEEKIPVTVTGMTEGKTYPFASSIVTLQGYRRIDGNNIVRLDLFIPAGPAFADDINVDASPGSVGCNSTSWF